MDTLDGVGLEDELEWCLEQGCPAGVTEALLRLADTRDGDELNGAWTEWSGWQNNLGLPYSAWSTFEIAAREMADRDIEMCKDCPGGEDVVWAGDAHEVRGGYVCRDHFEEYYQCGRCLDYVYTSETNNIAGYDIICDSCLESDFSYCDECEEYYLASDNNHAHDCDCEARHQDFDFPYAARVGFSAGRVTRDERVRVELPKGLIGESGINEIARKIQNAVYVSGYYRTNGVAVWVDNKWLTASGQPIDVDAVLDEIGNEWQSKRGNFTRRLSSALHKHGVKLEPGVLSEIGNIARAHASSESVYHIELTRDLNQSPEYFYHDGSCWFGNMAYSRCALKSWGGLAIRSFEREDDYRDNPSGRAWIQPLDANLQPTHDAVSARAFIVYNGYGDLSGYVPARLVAFMTSRTYKKIQVRLGEQYVNGNRGYLVADEETCRAVETITFDFDNHDTFEKVTV